MTKFTHETTNHVTRIYALNKYGKVIGCFTILNCDKQDFKQMVEGM